MFFAPLDIVVLAIVILFAVASFIRYSTRVGTKGRLGQALRSLGATFLFVFVAVYLVDNASTWSVILGSVAYSSTPRPVVWSMLALGLALFVASLLYDVYAKFIKPRFVKIPQDASALTAVPPVQAARQ